ncbi:MAG: hypothetical protein Roseis2KO_55240 [Roseivirga sp.]
MKACATVILFISHFLGFTQSTEQRTYGMLLGSAIGDAAGAPYEFFYPAQRSQWASSLSPLTPEGIERLAGSFSLHSHFRKASSYAHWVDYAPAGTITDDTRLKIILMNTLRHHAQPTASALATEILAFPKRLPAETPDLCESWLSEISKAARWQLDIREGEMALPSQRLWAGIPSIAGQMALLPLAALNPYDLPGTYKLAWELDFLDHGLARDINAAVVTGLAAALQAGASWASIEQAMLDTDPYGYGKAAYGKRALNRWLDFAHQAVKRSQSSPQKLFDILENELEAKVWWECWVPVVVIFALAEITDYQPLAAMQLCIEFGHDTDSYAQLMGAFMGALHGPDIFSDALKSTITNRLQSDFGENLQDWVNLLTSSKF